MSTLDNRRALIPLAAAVTASAFVWRSLPALAGGWPPLRALYGVEDRTASGRGFALTFDDGPHPLGTPAVLEILGREDVTATFFLVGEQVRRDPALAREIAARGHAIALHCDRHRNLLRLTGRQVREDIARALGTIESATGCTPVLYRPPYGILTTAALRTARDNGWRTMLWSSWGRDWEEGASADSVSELALAGAREGTVVLLHDADDYAAPGSWRATAEALPRIIDGLHDQGLRSAPL